MAVSIFDDKSILPDDNKLDEVLKETRPFWIALENHLKQTHGSISPEWKFYGQKYGWQLKMLKKKRNLCFLIPMEGYFRVVFVFGDKAVVEVENSDLPEYIIDTLKNARKYMEGRGIQIEVRSLADLEHVKKLVEIKVNN